MRSFSKSDLEILDSLSHADNALPLQIDEFLNRVFFTQQLGRALIIQAQNRYAVYFLATDIFEDEVKKKEELTRFTDLLSLLSYLLSNGYIAIHRNEKSKEKSMYFLQDSFINPQPSSNTIVLNASGDYTSSPDTIHSKDKQVAYKGVTFDHEVFELILSTMTGSLTISQSLHDIVEHHTKTKKRTIPGVPLIAAMLLTLLAVLTWLSASMHSNGKVQHQQMTMLLASHKETKEKIDKLTKKMELTDSIRDKQQRAVNTVVQSTATDTVLYGIDVSKWNGKIEEELDAVDSIAFVICKATEGKTSVDPRFNVNWNLLHERSMIKGAYHFYIAGDDPIRQADFYWSTVKQLDSTDIAPIVDIEDGSISSHSKHDQVKIQVGLLLFLHHLEAISGRVPMIYTNVAFADEYLTNDAFADYPLWLADYTRLLKPTIPYTWRFKGYKIWQKSDDYEIGSQNTDFDVFYGKIRELYN